MSVRGGVRGVMKNYFQLKRYRIDLIFIVLAVILALLLSGKPVRVQGQKQLTVKKAEQVDEAKATVKGPASEPASDGDKLFSELKARNIFVSDGSYALAVPKKLIPDMPYTLLGVMLGKEKKAVFREYTGAIVSLGIGAKMLDDSVISSIEKLSVKAKKGKEEKEYKIFDIRKK